MTFSEPFAPWMGTFWKGLIPQHTLQSVFDADGTLDNAEWNKSPDVSCGPFIFTEWESGSFARLVANEDYWLGRPKLDEIFIRFVPDDAAQIEALQNGDGDLGTFFAYEDVASLEDAGINVLKVYSGYNEGIYFNLGEKGHPALKDLKVRQAIAYGIDRFTLNEDLNLGLTVPAVTDWDNTPWVDPTLTPYPFDTEKANSLLDEAGWIDSNGDGTRDKDGTELVLKYGTTTRQIRVDTQAVFQQHLADIGIEVELLNYDSDQYFSGFLEGGPAATGELDMFQYSSTPNFPDPDVAEWKIDQIPTSENPDGTNWQAVNDQTLNDLFVRQSSEVDFATRQQTFYEISKYIYENVYWLGVWQDPDLWGISDKITGAKISGATPFYNIMEWELTE
jgi:peptide/nickel transport system substrate-binding protein